MAISLKTRKMLWGRAASRCAICRIELVAESSGVDDESLIGEECHIVSRSPEGPRGDYDLPLELRDSYDNLILLCRNHHKQVDDQVHIYTVEELRRIKREHEQWVRSALSFDDKRQRDEEIYAQYVDEWERLSNIREWTAWSSFVLSAGQPWISKKQMEQLEKLREWLLSRYWPKRYPELEAAFENFRKVLDDFCVTFMSHAVVRGEMWKTDKFYQIPEWNPAVYRYLMEKYIFHVDLVQDLMLELTRAGNYIIDKVREYLFPSYRIREGMLIVESGPYADMSFARLRVEYKDTERTLQPYPGLLGFLDIRSKRDVHFGEGHFEEKWPPSKE